MTTDSIAAVLDAAEIDERYQPTRTRTTICLNTELVMEILRLEDQLKALQASDSAAAPVGPLAERIIALQAEAKASEHEFVFKSIGRLPNRELIRDHPATDEQNKKLGEGERLEWNPDTYPPALLAVACETVRNGTAAWWARKWEEWGDGQVARLWQTCLAAQQGVNDVPKAAHAYAATRSRGESSD